MKFPEVGGGKSASNGGKLFIRMNDGEKINGVFRGDPHIFRVHWSEKRSSLCPGKANCEQCAAGDKAKFRFKINFLMKEDGVWIAKIFENNYGTFKDMKAMHESDYDLENTLVVVTRQGEKTNTRYNILPARVNLPPAEFKKISAIPLNELSDKEAPVKEAEQETMAEEDLPF